MPLTKFEFLLLSLRLLSISSLLFVTVNGVNSVFKSSFSPFESISCLNFRSDFCRVTSPFQLNFLPSNYSSVSSGSLFHLRLRMWSILRVGKFHSRSIQRLIYIERYFYRYKCRFWITLLLFLCGDVELNPGPLRYPCGICTKSVRCNQRGILCDSCDKWFHASCERISLKTYIVS